MGSQQTARRSKSGDWTHLLTAGPAATATGLSSIFITSVSASNKPQIQPISRNPSNVRLHLWCVYCMLIHCTGAFTRRKQRKALKHEKENVKEDIQTCVHFLLNMIHTHKNMQKQTWFIPNNETSDVQTMGSKRKTRARQAGPCPPAVTSFQVFDV